MGQDELENLCVQAGLEVVSLQVIRKQVMISNMFVDHEPFSLSSLSSLFHLFHLSHLSFIYLMSLSLSLSDHQCQRTSMHGQGMVARGVASPAGI